ncbi:HAD-IIA family hydrolase [Bacillus sp. H-16]|uniref:HAD-IIA family hydrolase n=1 Tax=Alteribacter salitolerans TaxID=2912333 RepID=UPI001962990C|nr:HAD-IIA family hydrolase [Alteribacter salitolerans]MBM7096863.1 HAD-IIA family hydrolase [Alteribacter salitolerans]
MQKGFIFDLDGTVYLGDEIIEGVPEAINALREKGHKILFLSNKSIASREDYLHKLQKMGIDLTIDNIINSNVAAAHYIKEHAAPSESAWVIGERPLLDELEKAGVPVTNEPLDASYVVLGWDRDFNYAKLNMAFQAWRNGATVVATNPDRTCPMENNSEIPDCGAIIGAFEGAAGQPVDVIAGKPSSTVTDIALQTLQLKPEDCYIIGDRLETDIKMGLDNNMKTVLVLSGITTIDMWKNSKYQPDYTLTSVKEIHTIVT